MGRFALRADRRSELNLRSTRRFLQIALADGDRVALGDHGHLPGAVEHHADAEELALRQAADEGVDVGEFVGRRLALSLGVCAPPVGGLGTVDRGSSG